jgi:hypothetical protein
MNHAAPPYGKNAAVLKQKRLYRIIAEKLDKNTGKSGKNMI